MPVCANTRRCLSGAARRQPARDCSLSALPARLSCKAARTRMSRGLRRAAAALLSAAAALAALAVAVHGSPEGLPTDWRVGKATYYGGAPDGCALLLGAKCSAWFCCLPSQGAQALASAPQGSKPSTGQLSCPAQSAKPERMLSAARLLPECLACSDCKSLQAYRQQYSVRACTGRRMESAFAKGYLVMHAIFGCPGRQACASCACMTWHVLTWA